MDIVSLIIFLVIGSLAGWMAGLLVRGHSFGLIGDIIVGTIGAIVAANVLPIIGLEIGGGFIGSVVNATLGAIIFLGLISFLRK